ncbi:hypothetical protein DLM45_06725 [Hyphomicrobium methylovorum]|nr:hypothetical protein [Hyphomicrobium methylovorum]
MPAEAGILSEKTILMCGLSRGPAAQQLQQQEARIPHGILAKINNWSIVAFFMSVLLCAEPTNGRGA